MSAVRCAFPLQRPVEYFERRWKHDHPSGDESAEGAPATQIITATVMYSSAGSPVSTFQSTVLPGHVSFFKGAPSPVTAASPPPKSPAGVPPLNSPPQPPTLPPHSCSLCRGTGSGNLKLCSENLALQAMAEQSPPDHTPGNVPPPPWGVSLLSLAPALQCSPRMQTRWLPLSDQSVVPCPAVALGEAPHCISVTPAST